jgi:hypothetical protein
MSACLFSLTDINFFQSGIFLPSTRTSCKSNLVKQFENEVSPVLSLPDFDPSLTTYIRDSMAQFSTWMQRSIEPLKTLLRARLKTISGLI